MEKQSILLKKKLFNHKKLLIEDLLLLFFFFFKNQVKNQYNFNSRAKAILQVVADVEKKESNVIRDATTVIKWNFHNGDHYLFSLRNS